jgi:hypothetical protein
LNRLYDQIVEYVNVNYGIVNVRDFKDIASLEERRKDVIDKKSSYEVKSVIDQLMGVTRPDESEFEGMLEFKHDVADLETNNSYLNVEYVKRFIEG